MKALEAMVMGCPVLAISPGVEGLPVRDGEHCLITDTPGEFSQAVVRLRNDEPWGARLVRNTRRYVEQNSSIQVAADLFEDACLRATATGE